MNSDYRLTSGAISRVAVIEFFLVQIAENCTFTRTCTFEGEGECAKWSVGFGVDVRQTSSQLYNSFTGKTFIQSIA